MLKNEWKHILIHISVMLASLFLFNIILWTNFWVGLHFLPFLVIALFIFSAFYGKFSTTNSNLKSLFLKQAIFFSINFISILLCFFVFYLAVNAKFFTLVFLGRASLLSCLFSLVLQLCCFIFAIIRWEEIRYKEKKALQDNKNA